MQTSTSHVSLFLTEKIDRLDTIKDTLIVRPKNGKIKKYPFRALRELILLKSCTVTSSTLISLAKANVPLLLLNSRGEFAAALQPPPIKNFYPRKAQFEKYNNENKRSEIAKNIVATKLNSIKVFTSKRGSKVSKSIEDSLKKAKSLNEIRGVEGVATREHYKRFEKWLKNKSFKFEGRNKRPPQDPINALLSLAYSLTLNLNLSAINTVGLDPAFGFLHDDYYGRPSLACDLMEPWRIEICDRFVLRLCNRKELNHKQFEYLEPGEGVVLNADGKRVFFKKWMQFIGEEERSLPQFHSPITYREAILKSTRNFSCWLMGETKDWP